MYDNLFEKRAMDPDLRHRVRQAQALMLQETSTRFKGKPNDPEQFIVFLMAAGISGKTFVVEDTESDLIETEQFDLPYCPLIVNEDIPILQINGRSYTQKELLDCDLEKLKQLIE